MAMYESDITKFIRELHDKNPEMAELQRKNRATWWDKKLDLDQQKRFQESAEIVNGYVYFPIPERAKAKDGTAG